MRSELRAKLWFALAYFVALEALLVGAVLFWPNFEANIAAIKSMLPIQALQDMADKIAEEGVVAYINGQHFFKACNALGGLAAVLFSMFAVAGEAQRGTLEIWISRPLTRRRILAERWLAGALALIVPVYATTLSIPWLAGFVHEELSYSKLMWCATHQSLFLLSMYALSFLFSCLSSNPLVVGFTMLLIALSQFALYMIQTLTHWSVFRLADIEVFGRIYNGSRLDWHIDLPLVVLLALTWFASLAAFRRRRP